MNDWLAYFAGIFFIFSLFIRGFFSCVFVFSAHDIFTYFRREKTEFTMELLTRNWVQRSKIWIINTKQDETLLLK